MLKLGLPITQPVLFNGTGGASSPLTDLASLLAGSSKSGIYLPTGSSDLYSDSGRTTSIIADSGNPIGAVDNYTGDAHLLQSVAASRPAATDGATLDGSDDYLSITLPGGAGSSNMTALIGIRTSDTRAVILSGDASAYAGYFLSGGGNPNITSGFGSPSIFIDDVDHTSSSRGVLHTAISSGSFHRFEVRNFNASTQSELHFGWDINSGLEHLNGTISSIVLIDVDDIGGDYPAALSSGQSLIDQINSGI